MTDDVTKILRQKSQKLHKEHQKLADKHETIRKKHNVILELINEYTLQNQFMMPENPPNLNRAQAEPIALNQAKEGGIVNDEFTIDDYKEWKKEMKRIEIKAKDIKAKISILKEVMSEVTKQ